MSKVTKLLITKLAGVLDPVQKNLAVDVWDEKQKLRPELKDQIMRHIANIIPRQDIMGVYILGSITGYKYTETSDIDVNIFARNYDPSMREKANQVNGFHSYGGRHPVNLFISEYKDKLPNWQDAVFGVYNVLKNDWEMIPPGRENFRDPQLEFKMEIDLASSIARQFTDKVEKVKTDVHSLNKLKKFKWAIPGLSNWYYKKKRNKIKDQLTDLAVMAQGLEDDRKFEYAWGWGTPRKNFRNIVYKLIEHGPHGELFLKLEKIDLPNQFGDEIQNKYRYKYATYRPTQNDKATYIFNKLKTRQ